MYQVRYNINDSKLEAGIDEAGRGPLWGPLMAAAVILPSEDKWTDDEKALYKLIKDSKKISEKKRIVIAEGIKKYAVSWSVGTVTAQEIDDHGMTWSNQTVFIRAVNGLTVKPDRLLVDGTIALKVSEWPHEQSTIKDGDAIYLSIAAASIIAKVEHDKWVLEHCKANKHLNERYNLEKCKGYGTAAHIAGIREHGLDEHHRRLFLRKIMGTIDGPASLSPKVNDADAGLNDCMIVKE